MLAVQYSTWLPHHRTTVLIGGVVLLHMAGLWALHTGLLQRATEWVIPVALVSDVLPMAVKPPPPPPPSTPSPPTPAQRAATAPTPLALAPEPVPQPTQTPVSPPTVAATAPVNAPVLATAPVAPVPSVVAVPVPSPPAKVDMPTTVADYQTKSPPVYPAMSKRMGEQGRVVVRVLISVDGVPQQAEVHQSSGFARLDRSAVEAAMRSRYVPLKRGEIPEATWVLAPMEFKLENE